MAWKVKAFAYGAKGRRFKKVVELDEYEDDLIVQISYWVRNMEPGDKVVVKRV